MKNLLIIKVAGGFGNQLFMITNALSLEKDYDLQLIIDSKSYDNHRLSVVNYKIFNKLRFSNNIDYSFDTSKYCVQIIKQNSFKYQKIILFNNKESNKQIKQIYILDKENSGYFQSYKFFNNNIDFIKSKLFIDLNLINKLKKKLKEIGPHISIHFRLTDYIGEKNLIHKVVDIDYYIKILFKYNLDKYKIILFTDDIPTAKSMLSEYIDIDNIIIANDIVLNDEDQLFFLACTQIRICPNSTYSLWSCYLNEMYNFTQNSLYYFPLKWFGPNGVKDYDIYDLIPKSNPRYKLITV